MNTFLEEFRMSIEPRIADIDVFLRAGDDFAIACVARLLSLCEDEVRDIMCHAGLSKIDRQAFLKIMQLGSSRICQLYAREVALASPPTYTSDDIAYIYNLDIEQVKHAFQKLKIGEVTALTMPLVFANIPYSNGA